MLMKGDISVNKDMRVSIGLYRHFKGQYFYVTNVCKFCSNLGKDGELMVTYFNVCHPEQGYFTRPLVDFVSDNDKLERFEDSYLDMGTPIVERKDNVTGQIHRMERVKDLNFQIGSVTTEQLIRELQTRVDSPIHELDLDGLYSPVVSHDYVIGVKHEATENTPQGVETYEVFDTEEEAKMFLEKKGYHSSKVYKRTFIEV